jgi:flagellar protein FliL
MATSAPKAASKPGLKPVPSSDTATDAAMGNKNRLLIIIAAVLLLAAIGGGGAWYYFGSKAEHSGPAGKAKPKQGLPPVFLPLESFTVNLQAEDMQQFLQVAMTLQISDEAQADLIKLNMPQVRNRLLLLLSGKKAADILSVEGKKKLSAEIVTQIRQPFTPDGPGPEISNVFFTSFVVQ